MGGGGKGGGVVVGGSRQNNTFPIHLRDLEVRREAITQTGTLSGTLGRQIKRGASSAAGADVLGNAWTKKRAVAVDPRESSVARRSRVLADCASDKH